MPDHITGPRRRYVLNSAVITAPGLYTYDLIDVQAATTWLADGPFESCIGYQETADALTVITGVQVPFNRVMAVMQPGDQALVFRIVRPAGESRVDPGDKGRLSKEYILEHCEIGLLRRHLA